MREYLYGDVRFVSPMPIHAISPRMRRAVSRRPRLRQLRRVGLSFPDLLARRLCQCVRGGMPGLRSPLPRWLLHEQLWIPVPWAVRGVPQWHVFRVFLYPQSNFEYYVACVYSAGFALTVCSLRCGHVSVCAWESLSSLRQWHISESHGSDCVCCL